MRKIIDNVKVVIIIAITLIGKRLSQIYDYRTGLSCMYTVMYFRTFIYQLRKISLDAGMPFKRDPERIRYIQDRMGKTFSTASFPQHMYLHVHVQYVHCTCALYM